MIETIHIENFRCFRDITLSKLKTVNIIVGRNASGKSALLEAFYFTLGSPHLAFKMRTWRGISGEPQVTDEQKSLIGLWRDLFFDLDQNNHVQIKFRGTPGVTRGVTISCDGAMTPPSYDKRGNLIGQPLPPITFEYTQGQEIMVTARPVIVDGAIQFDKTPPPLPGAIFPSSRPIESKEIAHYFSTLSRKNASGPLVRAMKDLFPQIEDISLQLHDQVPMVHARVKGVSEKIPLGLMSTGITRAFAFLSAIAVYENGILLIDEIENGFYFDTMSDIWAKVFEFCELYNVQLFVSTHSSDCLKSAEEVVKDHINEFTLIRVVQDHDTGQSITRQFPGKWFVNAIEENFEVR